MTTGDDGERGRSRSVRRLLGRAGSLIQRAGMVSARVSEAARDHLLIEAQQATFRELHRRFTERAGRGERGLENAVDALDAMWLNIRQLRGGAPAIMMTLSSSRTTVQEHLDRFYAESTSLLEDAIRHVFAEDLGHLAVPPDRMAVLVRIVLEGLVVELAQARSQEDVAAVDQAYADVRALFARFVLLGGSAPVEPVELDPIPLPW